MLIDFLGAGTRWTLVAGKGGVGKTTLAAALATAYADSGERTLVLSVDPAHSLGDALRIPLGAEARPVSGTPNLYAVEIDAARQQAQFRERYGEALLALIERGTYLTAAEIGDFLALSVPGPDELAALLFLADLARDEPYSRVVVDTAPTGHTLRLLSAPRLVREWLAALAELDTHHHAVVAVFSDTGSKAAGSGDSAPTTLAVLADDIDRLAQRITDPRETRFLLVTTAEPVVVAETRRFREALRVAGLGPAAIVVNRFEPGEVPVSDGEPAAALLPPDVAEMAGELPVVYLPLFPEDPRGLTALRDVARRACLAFEELVTPAGKRTFRPGEHPTIRLGVRFAPPTDRRLYLVVGKGGVGKTTVASALALLVSDQIGGRLLVLSTDPAGSLSEVWQVPVGPLPSAAPNEPCIELRQLEAVAAWAVFRDAHRDGAERLLAALAPPDQFAGGAAPTVGRLLELAPPGVDELMALIEVVDLLDSHAYNAIVLDTAPTGHLLRLLEMPHLALEWAHAVLRLLLRYREVTGLGRVGEAVLRLSRRIRRLQEQLQDSANTFVAVVALPEALSVPETERLFQRLRTLGLSPGMLLVNRLFPPEGATVQAGIQAARALLSTAGASERVGAPALAEGPRGGEELRSFAAAWRRVSIA